MRDLSRNANARHQTVAGLDADLFADFAVGTRVQTTEGFPGVITARQDGPYPGSESYEVLLDAGMGGGSYASRELSALDATTAARTRTARTPTPASLGDPSLHLASDDYEELREILIERPPLAHSEPLTMRASVSDPGESDSGMDEEDRCPVCGGTGSEDEGPCVTCGGTGHLTEDLWATSALRTPTSAQQRGASRHVAAVTAGIWDSVVAPMVDAMTPTLEALNPDAPNGGSWSYDWCFAGETEFLTFDGARAFKDVVGTEQVVLDGRGDWVKAEVRSFGVQSLRRLTLRKHRGRKVIYVTPEHRWFISVDGKDVERSTQDLTPGDRLAWRLPKDEQDPSDVDLDFDMAWTVDSVEETDRVEEVYCVVVPTTESFVLQSGILTGNCRFRKRRKCFYPEHLDVEGTQQAGYSVWVPFDRGICGRDKWTDQQACFSGDTEFLTYDGYRNFKDVAGTTQRVLTSTGQWVEAQVQLFGQQRLYKVALRRGNEQTKIVYATAGHRWFIKGRKRSERTERPGYHQERITFAPEDASDFKPAIHRISDVDEVSLTGDCSQCGRVRLKRVTNGFGGWRCKVAITQSNARRYKRKGAERSLKIGDRLAWVLPHTYLDRWFPSPVGVMHGFIFGDGSRDANPDHVRGNSTSVTLWGPKDAQLSRYFAGYPSHDVHADGVTRKVPGVTYRSLPGFFKGRPSLDYDAEYLYGWLAGYIAADGSVCPEGSVTLACADRETLEFVQTVCNRLTIATYMITGKLRSGCNGNGMIHDANMSRTGSCSLEDATPLYTLRFVAQTLSPDVLLTEDHRQRFLGRSEDAAPNMCWTVDSVEETDRVEEVYCAVVPKTGSFVLQDNILTGNCTVAEPGPHSKDPRASLDATVSWQDGGQHGGIMGALGEPSSPVFEFTASWADVREKARKIRASGGVRIISITGTHESGQTVTAEVRGTTNIYQTSIISAPGTYNAAQWTCGCAWSNFSWGRSGRWKKYEGRMCAHATALMWESSTFKGLVERPETPSWRTTEPVLPGDYADAHPDVHPKAASKRATLMRLVSTDPALATAPAVLIAASMLGEGSLSTEVAEAFTPAIMAQAQALNFRDRLQALIHGRIRTVRQIQTDTGMATLTDGTEVDVKDLIYPTFDRLKGLDFHAALDGPPASTRSAGTESVLTEDPVPALPQAFGDGDDEDDEDVQDDDDEDDDGGDYDPADVEDEVPSPVVRSVSALSAPPRAADPSLAWLMSPAGTQGSSGGQFSDAAIAAQASKALSKEAVRVFTSEEQRGFIEEGEDVEASNLDSLQIEGTHYAAIEDELHRTDGDEDWLS